jgi:hypothetical protein
MLSSSGVYAFFERSFRIRAVMIKNIHVLEAEAFQALVEAGENVLPRAPVAVGAVPHEVAGLGGDDEFVAMRGEILAQHPAEVFLRGAGRRAVVVGQIEVCDAEIEGAENKCAAVVVEVGVAEIVPEAEGEAGQLKTAASCATIKGGVVVASGRGLISHGKMRVTGDQ